MTQEYVSMAEAAKLTGYDPEYLGLLSRQGKINSKKVGKKWYTTIDHLNNYLEQKKPNEVIEKSKLNLIGRKRKGAGIFSVFLFLVSFVMVVFVYDYVSKTFYELNPNDNQNAFVPEETVRIPNENGGFDIYGKGQMKIGEEK